MLRSLVGSEMCIRDRYTLIHLKFPGEQSTETSDEKQIEDVQQQEEQDELDDTDQVNDEEEESGDENGKLHLLRKERKHYL